MSTTPQPQAAYSLFPSPSASAPPATRRPPSRTRRSESRERSRTRAGTPGAGSVSASAAYIAETTASRQGRKTPQPRPRPSMETAQPEETNAQPAAIPRQETPVQAPVQVQRPRVAADIPPRSETAFSEARTLVRSNSTRSRSSIAKIPFPEEQPAASSSGTRGPPPPLRSIFPQYNPDLPLNQQEYFPTQTSPTHIPRAVISRNMWHDDEPEEPAPPFTATATAPRIASPEPVHQQPQQQPYHAQPQHLPQLQIPVQAQLQQQPRRNLEMPPLPTESSNEQLKNLWKALNGWRASASDGRVYCMKLAQAKDSPNYTLSSRTAPFYSLRINPTSASALVSLSRHDPHKVAKGGGITGSGSGPGSIGSASSSAGSLLGLGKDKSNIDAKNWQEVLSTTLEPESRRHRPEDGLVAVLHPAAAAKIASDRPHDESAAVTSELECARLIWDDDSSAHYLSHPAITTPFCVTVERNAAWSRVEYTLEHHESPQHLAKLTRDGTGQGWLEVDTAVAARIESFFILDVAVAALLIVASGDDRTAQVETFEPPPPALIAPGRSGRTSAASFLGVGSSALSSSAAADAKNGTAGGKTPKKKSSRRKMEEFDVDVESQVSSGFAEFKAATKEKRRKLPWPLRISFKILGGLFKCFIWCLTMTFKALAAIVIGMVRCLGLGSKGG